MLTAHVLAPSGAPLVASWLAALALFGGALGVVAWWQRRRWRAVCTTVAGAGLVASAALLVAQPSAPLRPGYGIALVDARLATSPVVLRVCGVFAATTTPPVPGPGRLLLVTVDGRQAAEVRSSTVVLSLPAGSHHLTAQLLTSDHRAFVPPVTTDLTVTVTGPGPLSPEPQCPR